MIKKIKSRGNIYFVGVGGIGMSGLARYFKSQGYTVSGSDSPSSFAIPDALKKEGIKVKIGYNAKNIDRNAQFIVYNRAIPLNHPELLAAAKLGIPAIPYAKVLGEITKQYATIAITGSHGKSTTTALAALALIRAGLDPTVLIGTNLKQFDGKNIHIGKERSDRPNYLVLEADDYGAAFLEYSPLISIITNIDREHIDFYKTFAGVKTAFLRFIEKTREHGTLILNQDDATLYSLRTRIIAIAKKRKLRVIWYSTRNKTAIKIKSVLKLPGEHNLSNAMAVYELGRLLKINEKKILLALGLYEGSWRRMEYRGIAKLDGKTGAVKAKVYDDYAHHPTEIKATLRGFKEKFTRNPIICVFQPHQAKRLELLFKEFISAFNDADILILLPFYKVAGRDEKASPFTSERLAHAIVKKYPQKNVYYVAKPKRLKDVLTKIVPKNPVIVMMGAGDIIQYTDLLL